LGNKLIGIVTFTAAVLYFVLFFAVPLYGLIAAYILCIYFGFCCYGAYNLLMRTKKSENEKIVLSNEEINLIEFLKNSKMNFGEVATIGASILEQIDSCSIPKEHVGIVVYNAENSDLHQEMLEAVEKINIKYKKS
jgi:hypothetical protein